MKEVHVPFDDRNHRTGNKDATHAARAEQAESTNQGAKLPNPDCITSETEVPTNGGEWRTWLSDSKVKRRSADQKPVSAELVLPPASKWAGVLLAFF